MSTSDLIDVSIHVIPLGVLETGDYTEEQQAVINDAKEQGLTLARPLCRVTNEVNESRIQFTGQIPIQGDNLEGAWGIELDFPNEIEQHVFLRVCHAIGTIADNPLSLHWRHYSGDKPRISIEGIELVENTKSAKKYTSDLCELIPVISKIIRPRGGRPPETRTYSKEERKELASDARKMKRKYPKMTWEAIAIKFNVSVRYLQDVRNEFPDK